MIENRNALWSSGYSCTDWTVRGGCLITAMTIHHRSYNSFKIVEDCRRTAVSMDTTLERWWAKTRTPPAAAKHPHSWSIPPFSMGSASPARLVSGAAPQHHPHLGAALCSPAQQHQLKAQKLSAGPGKQEVTQTLLSAACEAFMLCVIFIYCLDISQPGQQSILVI